MIRCDASFFQLFFHHWLYTRRCEREGILDFVPTTAAALGSTATYRDGLKSKKNYYMPQRIKSTYLKEFIDIVGPKALPINNYFPLKMYIRIICRQGRAFSLHYLGTFKLRVLIFNHSIGI